MVISNIHEMIMDHFRCYKSVEALYSSQLMVCGWIQCWCNESGEYEEKTIALNEGYSLSELRDFLEKAKELDYYKDHVDFQIWKSNHHLIFSDIDEYGNCHTGSIHIPVIPKSLVSK